VLFVEGGKKQCFRAMRRIKGTTHYLIFFAMDVAASFHAAELHDLFGKRMVKNRRYLLEIRGSLQS